MQRKHHAWVGKLQAASLQVNAARATDTAALHASHQPPHRVTAHSRHSLPPCLHVPPMDLPLPHRAPPRRPAPLCMPCVYKLVLSSVHVITISCLKFITLGHGIDSHSVLAHAFFGTQVLSSAAPLVSRCVCARARRRVCLWPLVSRCAPCVHVLTNATPGCSACRARQGLRSRRGRRQRFHQVKAHCAMTSTITA